MNRLNILGIFMMILSILLYTEDFLDKTVTMLLYLILEGSSEGKAILFFMIMGSMLVIYPLFRTDGKVMRSISISRLSVISERGYLKLTILLILFTYAVAMMTEVLMRVKFGISIFTTFVSLNPTMSTTSITHSHVFKASLGVLINSIGMHVPVHINTGISLIQYVSPFLFVIFVTFPLVYITSILSLNKRRDSHKLIIAFSSTTSLIGMIDGGIFSVPALVGLSGLLGMCSIKKPFSPHELVKPAIFMGIIILVGLLLINFGSNSDFYEITVIGQEKPIDLSGYDILDIEHKDDKSIIKLSTKIGDKKLLIKMTKTLDRRCKGFFISWNFFSFFNSLEIQ